jgi:hypothetical protein
MLRRKILSPTTLDDRTFESNEVLSPEQQKAASDYFEAKGYEVSTETDQPPAAQPAAPAKEPAAPRSPKEGAVASGAQRSAQPGTPPATADPDQQWHAAKTEQEKLGCNARRTKKIKELTETVAERDASACVAAGRRALINRHSPVKLTSLESGQNRSSRGLRLEPKLQFVDGQLCDDAALKKLIDEWIVPKMVDDFIDQVRSIAETHQKHDNGEQS